jgi:hypothetical protein
MVFALYPDPHLRDSVDQVSGQLVRVDLEEDHVVFSKSLRQAVRHKLIAVLGVYSLIPACGCAFLAAAERATHDVVVREVELVADGVDALGRVTTKEATDLGKLPLDLPNEAVLEGFCLLGLGPPTPRVVEVAMVRGGWEQRDLEVQYL